jgi:hypothetical protein
MEVKEIWIGKDKVHKVIYLIKIGKAKIKILRKI